MTTKHLECLASPEDGSVRLHDLLHLYSHFRGRCRPVSKASLVEVINRGLAGVRGKR